MNKMYPAMALSLVLLSPDAVPQSDDSTDTLEGQTVTVDPGQARSEIQPVQVAQAVPKIDLEWADRYDNLILTYMRSCGSVAPRQSRPNEAFACENLKSVIETLTEERIFLSRYTVSVFERQGTASNIVLAVVVFIVISGIALTAYQLRIAAKKGGPQSSTDLEASAAKVRITSSSVGIVVLVVSLLFFYLYIKEIYKIVEVPVS